MTRAIWIVRHASRLDFEDPSWFRSARRPHDPPLSPRGRAEARLLAGRLASEPVAHVFASPFLRAVETAAPLAETLRLPIALEPGLSEWLNVAWFPRDPATLPMEELARRFPSIDRVYRARGDARWGESGEQALQRAGATAQRLAREFAGDLVLVGHGASVLGAIAGLLGPPHGSGAKPGGALQSIACASITRIVEEHGSFVLAMAPDTSHLTGDGTDDPRA